MTAVFADFPLDEKILQALEKCQYQNPTPIQAQSIPHILNHRDLIACAQTGTGKTAAFVLPILQKLISGSDQYKKPKVLILTPTRELAAQITQAIRTYGSFMKIQLTSLVGGASYKYQIRDLSKPNLDLIVATPGRLMDHLENRKVDLSGIETLVLDEADRMLDMGFIDDVLAIAKQTPKNRQTLLFSATIDDRLSGITKKLLKEPVQIHIKSETKAPALIKQELYFVNDDDHKIKLLKHFMDTESIFKAVIFSATKINADDLSHELNAQGYKTKALHGDLNQSKRNQALELFNSGKVQFLIATDVAARGINVKDVTHVFNYDLPKFAEDYVHRIGRTGRAGKAGKAISFALGSDVRNVARIERFIKAKLDRCTVDGLEPKANIEKIGATSKKSKSDRFSDRFKSSGSSRGKSFSKDREKTKSYGKSESRDSHKKFTRDSKRSDSKSSFRKEESSFSKRPRKSDDDFGGERKFTRDRDSRDSFNRSESKSFSKRPRKSDDDFGGERKFNRDRDSRDSFNRSESKTFSKRPRKSDDDFGGERKFTRDRDSFRSSEPKRSFRKSNDQAREIFSSDEERFSRPKKKSFSSERHSDSVKRGLSGDHSFSKSDRGGRRSERDIFSREGKRSPRAKSDSWQTRSKEGVYRSEKPSRENSFKEKPSVAYSKGRYTEESKSVEVSYKKNRSNKIHSEKKRR